MDKKNKSREIRSEVMQSLRGFKSNYEEDKKQVDDYSAVEFRKSEFSADEDDKFFFLNFIQSNSSYGDDHSAVQSNYQPKIHSSRTLSELCEVHKLPYVAYCAIHQELVCEDCTDSDKHIDHNDKILLLKAAAQDIINKVTNVTNDLLQNDEFLNMCSNFKLKSNFRKMIMEFFEYLHEKLREIERQKMEELSNFFQSMN